MKELRAEIKDAIREAESYGSLKDFVPVDPFDVEVNIDLNIGPVGNKGSDIFYGQVCTVKALPGLRQRHPEINLDKVIVITEYSYEAVRERIEEIINNAKGTYWIEIAEDIGKHLHWEFEGDDRWKTH